jgi:hypothetical protein
MTYLALLDMNTLEQKMLQAADKNFSVGFMSWNKDGDKIAFWRITRVNSVVNKKLLIYSVGKDEFTELDYGDDKSGLNYDWLANEDKIIVNDLVNEIPRMRILNDHLEVESVLTLREEIKNHWMIWGLDNAVLVQRSRRGGFWRLDLKTEEWKKVF